ncbi:MAG: hypothetical protein GY861_19020 [bacterium]|nr:hypothetical protein [bacterium]
MELTITYKQEFDLIAFTTLSEKALRSKTHVCSKLNCTKETLDSWMEKNPSLSKSIDKGLIEGEKLFRNKLAKMSIKGTGKVNTKLLLTLAYDVYGITDGSNSMKNIESESVDSHANRVRQAVLDIEDSIPVPDEIEE